jgi:DNA invertase Pin-like site-specific DNA recombinase
MKVVVQMVNVKVKKVVGYVRVSSDSQIDNTSVQEQKERIKAYCVSQGWELTKFFIDEGKSGSTIDRVGYQNMIEYTMNPEKEITGIVVLKADRIHRSLKNLLFLIQDQLEPAKIAFVSVQEKFDTSTPQGMLFLQMVGSFGEFERKQINERTRSGRIATAKKEKYAGGSPAYAYEVLNGNIVLNDTKAGVVQRIFEEFVEGSTMYKIAGRLNKEGIPTKQGSVWKVPQIKNILTNETYTGVNTYNGPKEKNHIIQKNVFPRIISKQLFNKAQYILNTKS